MKPIDTGKHGRCFGIGHSQAAPHPKSAPWALPTVAWAWSTAALLVVLGCLWPLAPAVAAATAAPDRASDRASDRAPRSASVKHGDRSHSVEETARRVALTLRTGRSSIEPVQLADPPTVPVGAMMAWDDLQLTLQAMDRWLAAHAAPQSTAAPHEQAFARLARLSRQAAAESHTEMVQVHTDFASALRLLEKAVRLMTSARATLKRHSPQAIWATQVLHDLTAVAARLAEDGLQRARNGGVDGQRLNAAAHALQQGLALLQAGQHLQAFGSFGLGITVGAIPVFNMDRFESNLNDAFGPQTVGYQYAIGHNGALARASGLGLTGLARTDADPPNTSQVASKEINIASISKTITAMVLLRLLEQRNVSVDSPIAPWLPASWVLGAGIGPVPAGPQLSFRELLTHRSGLNANLNTSYQYADLQNYAAAGISAADKLVTTYQNANFAMFRVVIPYLRYGSDGVDNIAALVPFASFDEVIAGLYIETVRDLAFAPTGFVQGGCVASDPNPTLSYPFPSNGAAGIQPGDWITRCGSGGWYLSSVELLGVMAFRRFSNLILSPAARQLMDFNYLGWHDPTNPVYGFSKGLYGNYRSHGGDLTVSGPLDACYMEFFNGVQVAMVANSAGGNYLGNNSYQCTVLKWAFENAFIAP